MTIRLWGLDDECHAAIERLRQIFVVTEVSGPYANREGSKLVRYFVHTHGLRLCASQRRSGSSCTSAITLPRKSSTKST